MSSESPPARKARTKPAVPSAPSIDEQPALPTSLRVLDWLLIAAFLALAFLLGIFPLKDTDFWWHLRTGDWIRAHRTVPTTDLFTFTVPDHPWIDLHWGFQVAISWGYEHVGVVGLNLAKCAITVLALWLVITARKRDWPVWVMLLAWLPALIVLSGRMYVRPETLTLLYLCTDLAILFRWDKQPRLAYLLPIVQVAWVNSQGLFVLGPILIGFALIAAVFRPGAFAASRAGWWRTVGVATLLTGAACLLNPYGLMGALYPLQLLQTMGNPIFSQAIAELTPIPVFIQRNVGWRNVPLGFQLLTIGVGAASFVIPILWSVSVRGSAPSPAEPQLPAPEKGGAKKEGAKSKRRSAKQAPPSVDTVQERGRDWSKIIFRFLLFAVFCRLSWQATRNSHQFAAVVGTITAWNLAEWAAAVNRRRARPESDSVAPFLVPRLVTLGCLVLVFAFVASGQLYEWSGEDRHIGLGEEPLWFPHEAVKFAGKPGMPGRFLSFHDGYAALYDYYHGAERTPGQERKVYVDARLEVIGPELYEQYTTLQRELSDPRSDSKTGLAKLDAIGRPVVLAGHVTSALVGANLMNSARWRCVWFDPIVAVFVHDTNAEIVRRDQVDFAERHFRSTAESSPQGVPALTAAGKALWSYASALQGMGRSDLSRPIVLLGLDYARQISQANPDALTGWKLIGQLEASRELPIEPSQRVPRFRLPFDPVFDLSAIRATYALRRAHLAAPDDFLTLLLLSQQFADRLMHEARVPLLERLSRLRPINPTQSTTQADAAAELSQIHAQLGAEIGSTWNNLSELDRIVAAMLASGRVARAAELLERAYPSESRPWEVTDRIATLRLHLGEAEQARLLWQNGGAPPRPGIRSARIAMTYLAENAFDDARRHYQDAIRDDAELFEAQYGLAVLEQDAGHAPEALRHARLAVKLAPNAVSKVAAETIVGQTLPFTEL